ncbi:MAG: hypothetical protein O2888_05995 [Chloroflexi bacterium]|nr:hypothetical protein [Chloroflexota bacterium]
MISQTDKVDYFFQAEADMRAFGLAARVARDQGEDFQPDLRRYNGATMATAGDFHYEVTYAGTKVQKLHPSGGRVDTGTGGYDDLRIKAIYQKAIGFRT